MSAELTQLINLDNFDGLKSAGQIVENVQIEPLSMARRNEGDTRGYLVQVVHPKWSNFYNDRYPIVQGYGSFTYTGIARDEDQWHVHPLSGQERGVEQIDRWSFWGKAIAAVADPRSKILNLFQMGFGWGQKGGFMLLIPPHKYHGFLSAGGMIDWEKREGVIIHNYPDKPYNDKEPQLIEGRKPFKGSGIYLPNGKEFNWNDIRKQLGLPEKDASLI